jgi:hypothetical protein
MAPDFHPVPVFYWRFISMSNEQNVKEEPVAPNEQNAKEEPVATETTKLPTALELARESLVRTGRSQQLALPHLLAIMELVDWAIETGWTPPPPVASLKDAQGREVPPPTVADFKMTSEGFPVDTSLHAQLAQQQAEADTKSEATQ